MKFSGTHSNLVKLEKTIGITDTVELVQTALPIIIERKATLSRLLLADDLEGSSTVAHMILGSIRLYGTDELENLLMKVKYLDSKQDNLVEFQSQISAEFSSIIEACQDWLKNHG